LRRINYGVLQILGLVSVSISTVQCSIAII